MNLLPRFQWTSKEIEASRKPIKSIKNTTNYIHPIIPETQQLIMILK